MIKVITEEYLDEDKRVAVYKRTAALFSIPIYTIINTTTSIGVIQQLKSSPKNVVKIKGYKRYENEDKS